MANQIIVSIPVHVAYEYPHSVSFTPVCVLKVIGPTEMSRRIRVCNLEATIFRIEADNVSSIVVVNVANEHLSAFEIAPSDICTPVDISKCSRGTRIVDAVTTIREIMA